MALDLNTLPAYFIAKYGRDKVAEVVGKPIGMVALWEKTGRFTIEALQRLLTFDPGPLGAVTPLYTIPGQEKRLVILVPLASPPAPKMMDTVIMLMRKGDMDYRRYPFNCLSISRNVLAAEFLRGPWDEAFWMDGDALLPAGRPMPDGAPDIESADWFREAADVNMPDVFAGLHSIYRARYHKKSIVSCSYVARRKGGPVQFGGDPKAMRDLVKRGPMDKLIEVPWCGFHGVLTHRSVFEDIIRTQGDEIRMKPGGIGDRFKYQYAFFHPTNIEMPSDDIPFCNRALRAGHKIHVDLAIAAAHVGDRPYTFQDL